MTRTQFQEGPDKSHYHTGIGLADAIPGGAPEQFTSTAHGSTDHGGITGVLAQAAAVADWAGNTGTGNTNAQDGQDIGDKLDELIGALRAAGIIAS